MITPQQNYDLIILVDSGIGNAIQALYTVEYCLENKVKVGIFLNKVSTSFQSYLRACYGEDVILRSLHDIYTKNLIQSFTYQAPIDCTFENYFYSYPDFHSSKVKSETEQLLSIAHALFPSTYKSHKLNRLLEENSQSVQQLLGAVKYILIPGAASAAAVKRWPYFTQLATQLGIENIAIVGGADDLNFTHSYIYPTYFKSIFPQGFLNNPSFWALCKKLHLLKSHAHLDAKLLNSRSYIDKFKWPELVYLLKHCHLSISNDTGLMHLAGAVGGKGIALFGPTSVDKNKSYNPNIKPIHTNYPCQPCQFGVGGITMTQNYINCPYGVKCLYNLTPINIIK